MHTPISYSIVIPMYNKANVVMDTINSVREQTFKDFECIIVDDGSTDDSVLVVEKYLREDARFRLIKKHNGGVSSARNEGIRQAKKPYIAFLDADDLWNKYYLEVMSFLIDSLPNNGIYGCGWRHLYGSFACWGALLNANPDKQVYYPFPYLGIGMRRLDNMHCTLPQTWIRVFHISKAYRQGVALWLKHGIQKY